jgi:hypothetical protein
MTQRRGERPHQDSQNGYQTDQSRMEAMARHPVDDIRNTNSAREKAETAYAQWRVAACGPRGPC